MGGFQIYAADGAVAFPDGTAVRAETTRARFLATAAGRAAREYDRGTRPWMHHAFAAGEVEGKPLLVNACFYDELLVNLTMTADLEPGKAKDWSNYSLDAEAATKRFHDAILEAMLGPATTRTRLGIDRFTVAQATLAEPAKWVYPWGKVVSGHDLKGGGTSIVVDYGDRNEEANRDYWAKQGVRD